MGVGDVKNSYYRSPEVAKCEIVKYSIPEVRIPRVGDVKDSHDRNPKVVKCEKPKS
jgi:hypothetical protein